MSLSVYLYVRVCLCVGRGLCVCEAVSVCEKMCVGCEGVRMCEKSVLIMIVRECECACIKENDFVSCEC